MDKVQILVQELEKKRGKVPIVKFAKYLGIHWNTYYRILRGERGVGPKTLEKVLARYPDLALLFLPGYSPVGDSDSLIGK